MELRRLRLVNFRQHADTELELGTGVTAIIGPNGAGKSTLLEAIAWALYGNPAAREGKDTIRWRRAPARSQVRVELDLRLGGHQYRVSRGLYDAQLFQDRGATPISTGTQEVTAVLTRLLGMTRDEFFNTYFTGQKELAVMAALGAAERGRFLSKVLGYEKLRLAQDAVRIEKNRVKAELTGLEHGLGDTAELEREVAAATRRHQEAAAGVKQAIKKKEEAEKALEQVGPQWSRMGEQRQMALSLDGERRAAEHAVVDAKREFERLDKELAVALDAQARVREMEPQVQEVEPLRRELERLDAEGRAAGLRRDLTGQLKEVDSQLSRVRARLQETGGLAARLKDAERSVEQAQRDAVDSEKAEATARGNYVREKEHAQTKLDELRQQYRDIKEQRDTIEKLGPEGLCPTCGRKLGKDFGQMVGTLTRQMEAVEENGQFYSKRMKQLEAEPGEVLEAGKRRAAASAVLRTAQQLLADTRSAGAKRAELEKEEDVLSRRSGELARRIADLPEKYDAERHDLVRDRLRELEPLIQQAARFSERAERAPALVGEMETAEKRLSERETRARDLARTLAELGYSEERYLEARERYQQADTAAHAAREDLVTHRGDLKAAEGVLAQVKRRVDERAARAARIDALRIDLRLHEELDQAYGELRTDLNAQMRPELSDIASSLIADLTEGRYSELELDEDYSILLMDGGVPVPVISGGEEDIANLVLRLAISQLVAERAGQPLSLLVLDEIFGSLDDARREHVVSLLRGLADRFPQVILITHIESVRDRVDRVLRVSFDASRGAASVADDSPAIRGLRGSDEPQGEALEVST